MGKNENNGKTIVIGLLVAIIIVVAGICVYFAFIKKNDVTQESKTKLFHIVNGDDCVLLEFTGELKESQISFDYPQFDIDSEEIKKVNNEISALYKKEYESIFGNVIDDSTELHGFYVSKDGKKYHTEDMFIPSYNISETENYLSILILDKRYALASGYEESYGYVIDKKTNKILSNEEVLKLFDVTKDDFISYYNQYGGCPLAETNSISSLNNQKIVIKDKELYFENHSCCCVGIEKYNLSN